MCRQAIAAPVAQVHNYVRREAAVQSTKPVGTSPRQAWLWTLASDQVTVFTIRSRRDTEGP